MLKCVSKGLSDINTAVNIAINALGNVSTISNSIFIQLKNCKDRSRMQSKGSDQSSKLDPKLQDSP